MKRALTVGLLVVGLVGLAVTPLLVQGPTLAVTDGSNTGLIDGNLTNVSSLRPLMLNFTATTYANQTTGPASTLVMEVQAGTVYVGGSPGYLEIKIGVTILAHFASDIRPNGLLLASNQTGTAMDAIGFDSGQQAGTNVSFDPQQGYGIGGWGNGSWTAEATPVNEDAGSPYYNFSYTAGYIVWVYMGSDYLGSEHFVGFRATVEGPFTPAASVGILVQIINTSGGI